MPRVTCRCGEKLIIPVESPDHLDCIRCGARIRLRRAKPRGDDFTADGFIRFLCPCGRRLKVSAEERPKAGKCPDCGRVLPVPLSGIGISVPAQDRDEADVRTEELDATDVAELEKWSARLLAAPIQPESNQTRTVHLLSGGPDNQGAGLHSHAIPNASVVKFETGLRVCPRCKKPLHLSADNCRECGMPVPRQH